MIFNSLDYFLFLPPVVLLYFLLPLAARQWMLIAASFFFYMVWNARYSLILVFFIFLDFTAGLCIAGAATQTKRKLWLISSLGCNLGVLVLFKYYGFLAGTLRDLGLIRTSPALGLLLPLGISFHTFQTMSYTIDVYRGVIPPERSLRRFALFVSFFPQLVAGPIERGAELLPQLTVKHAFDWDDFVTGSRRILDGVVKKAVLADNIAPWVNQVYGSPSAFSGSSCLLATWLFAAQICFDFSGYSDIAIGTARLMGFRFTENFDKPYISTSIQEFWRRWHMSLSRWLRDYLYVSLGGNRRGTLRTYANLFITMLLGGLWHGASWNFVIWGGLHGAWLSVERVIRGKRVSSASTPIRWLKAFFVFNGVCVTWVFFRARNLTEASAILGRILHWTPGSAVAAGYGWYRFLLIMLLGGAYFALPWLARKPRLGVAWSASLAGVLLLILFGAKSNEFIYFIF
ncbi:MAG TPA: MBOAT family O-acyltransferase [Myxococcales bacterium]|jgi:D-alanyl-lipoteichoic acid acyltransferase DltB (MBOAT superfamily)|nr:MBOAT family O-acyltransferase [Myxococcales bacterium]